MKKRIVMLCAALTVCVILCGCVSEGRGSADVSGSPEATAPGAPQTLEFEASYEPTGPFGAKSIGEVVINTPSPAIAQAVARATGVWHRTLPITPEKVLMGMEEA